MRKGGEGVREEGEGGSRGDLHPQGPTEKLLVPQHSRGVQRVQNKMYSENYDYIYKH